jgi:hypothetical protein
MASCWRSWTLVHIAEAIAQIPHHWYRSRDSTPRTDHWSGCRLDSGQEVRSISLFYHSKDDTDSTRHSNLPLPTANGGPYEGDLTYYNPALGSCGYTNTDSDMICAVSHILYDAASTGSNPNANPLCGLKIRLRRNGESVDVKIVDRCVGCAVTDLDVTEAVFKKVADLDQGRVPVEWSWLETPPVSVS